MAKPGNPMSLDALGKPILWGVGTVRTLRAHWVLNELGVDYTTQAIRPRTDAMEQPDFLDVNPDKKVPALQHGDLTLVESAAIMIYLAETFADRLPGLIPKDRVQRARFFEWMSFISTELDAASLYTIRKHQDLAHTYGSAPVAVDAAGAYFLRMVQKPARVFTSDTRYLLGDQFTLPDILLFTCLRFAERMGVERPAEFESYYKMLAVRPAFQAAERANYP